jgi:hypothetical protein
MLRRNLGLYYPELQSSRTLGLARIQDKQAGWLAETKCSSHFVFYSMYWITPYLY